MTEEKYTAEQLEQMADQLLQEAAPAQEKPAKGGLDEKTSASLPAAALLNGNEKLRISVNLSCHYRLLLVSARHTSCSRHSTLSRSYVKLLYKIFRIIAYIVFFQKAEFIRKFGFEITLKHYIVFERIVKHKSVFVSVFGNMAYSARIALSYRCVGYILSAKRDLAAFKRFKSCYSDQRVYKT